MAWWNPLDWAAQSVAGAMKHELEDLYEAIEKDPQIIYLPVAGVVAIIGLAFGGKSFAEAVGRYAGEHYLKE